MREVISVHVGQAGVQIGNACCESRVFFLQLEALLLLEWSKFDASAAFFFLLLLRSSYLMIRLWYRGTLHNRARLECTCHLSGYISTCHLTKWIQPDGRFGGPETPVKDD